ncbi:hypothetical protein BDZ91DRAFT_9805 [Kalaharituber pfeilii]|nr:hypothetical protein BDZ91DRAFT_9805 [Kalaharituber pfeilii]
MVENFEKPQPREVPDGASILSRMMTVLIPRIGHLKSANVFMEHDLMYSSMQHQILRTTVTVPLTEAVGKLSRISSLEISGQENVTPEFGRAIQKLRPSIILNSSNSTISRNATFALRITGSRRIWQGSSGIGSSGSLDNLELSEELRRNKAFLAALNPNSVTSVDFDITDDWGWTPESVSDFLLRQARTLKILRIRGFGDTLSTWQLLDRMGRKGFRVRGLDLDNRHVQHPPVIFDPTAWALQTVFLKKLKYLAVDGFQGIMNSATNYHMIDPTQFSILLKSSLFGKVSGTRMTPPVKTLKLSGIRMGSKVPEQIGAWVMQLVPTLTTLEIGYLNYGHNPDSDFSYSAHCREQGRYKLIEVLSRLEKLRRFKATGYAAEILLCGCITPVDEEEEDDGLPRSPPRPSTPIGPSAVGSNWPHEASWHPSQVHYTKHRHPGRPSGGTKKRSPAAARLFEETWPETLEELELSPSYPIVFTMYNGFVDDSLMLFTKLERLRVLALLYRQERKGVSLLSAVNSEEDESQQRESSKDAMEKTGLLTPEGMLTFVKALPKMQHVEQKFMLKKFWLAERFMNPNARRELPNQDLSWTKAIGDMMKQMGTDFEFVNNCS